MNCPHCGGALYRDPEESLLRCLLCAREYAERTREPLSASEPPVLTSDEQVVCEECGRTYPRPKVKHRLSGRCARCAGRANVALRVRHSHAGSVSA